jgi:transketolase
MRNDGAGVDDGAKTHLRLASHVSVRENLHTRRKHGAGFDKSRRVHNRRAGKASLRQALKDLNPHCHVTDAAHGIHRQAHTLGMQFRQFLAPAQEGQSHQRTARGHTIVDHRTYVFVGDGCLMEGISHEAASLAGTWGLGKLVVFYDDNGISIDGETKGWFTDDTAQRFAAYGWHVQPAIDGHDVAAVAAAIVAALADGAQQGRPQLLCCRTQIGKGAPTKAGTAEVHGAALGEKEVAAARLALGWAYPPFVIPDALYQAWDARARAQAEQAWAARFAAYRAAYPELAAEFARRMAGDLPANFGAIAAALVAAQAAKGASVATRKASQQAIEALAPQLPELIGGAADLTGSVFTDWSRSTPVTRTEPGNYIHFGVREFGMSAIANGLALHGGLIPYVGTFLTFSDYARNALRMAALMRLRTLFIFTHDSIGLGEDGPTHQAVEHAASLRAHPQLDVWRPCTRWRPPRRGGGAGARRRAERAILTRQNVPFQPRDAAQLADRQGRLHLADWDATSPAAWSSLPPAPRWPSRWARAPRWRRMASAPG